MEGRREGNRHSPVLEPLGAPSHSDEEGAGRSPGLCSSHDFGDEQKEGWNRPVEEESGGQVKDLEVMLRVIHLGRLFEALGPEEVTWFQGEGQSIAKEEG